MEEKEEIEGRSNNGLKIIYFPTIITRRDKG